MILKEEILEICNELEGLDSGNFSWQYIRELYNKGKEKIAAAKSTETTDEIKEAEVALIITVASETIYKYVEAINKGEEIPPKYLPSDDDLNFFREIAEEVPKTFALLEKEDERKIPEDDDKLRELKKNNEQLKTFLQQEKKIQSLENEVSVLSQKVAELQNQIKELLAKQEKEPLDQNTKQEVQQKIASLENQKQEIQSELNKKQTQKKELNSKANSQQNNQQSNNPDKFNWLYVVIPGGILLVVIGIVIAYLVGKKSKKE